MVRLSTLATSTFTSALKVLSTVLPDSMFFSFVRTTAPPLPGLWCWNQMTDHSWPSRLRTMPFLRSLVVAMRCGALSRRGVMRAEVSLRRSRCSGCVPGSRTTSCGTAAQSSEPPASPEIRRSGFCGGCRAETVGGPSYRPAMETTQTTTPLSTEDYWAQVQALRDALARLRPPGRPRGPVTRCEGGAPAGYRETSARSASREE